MSKEIERKIFRIMQVDRRKWEIKQKRRKERKNKKTSEKKK